MPDLVKTLANHMHSRKRAKRQPYVLVLGAGASLSSGCSSYSELVDDFLDKYCAGDLATLNQEQDERTREERKRERFYQEWRNTGTTNRYVFLSQHLGGDPSSGYDYLAWLVRNEYLRLIFSTNLDDHVEVAFTNAGLVRDKDYELLTNAPNKGAEIIRRLDAPEPSVKLVKLHGTLSQKDSYAWLPEEVFAFEDELEEALRGYLNNDVVIVGHRMDDRDLDLPFRAAGGEIWFVNPGGARDTRFRAVLEVRAQSHTLKGDEALFDEFFAALHIHFDALETGAEAPAEEPVIHRFLRAIGLPSQIEEPRSRYLHLPELYVRPEEYDRIRAILAKHHTVVIAGEPHMGKTYTALHLLWERFQDGWHVVHMKRDGLADALRQCNHDMSEFTSRHIEERCLLHLDDPFGETEYQPLGPLQKDLSSLVHEVQRHDDCALIITSRIGIFNEAMDHLEGAALFREMGVEADIRVHTSYSEETRREVLERYLNLYEPPWAADGALREAALAKAPSILEAPHNLELFARRSEGISDKAGLLNFAHSCTEIVSALAEWIARLAIEDQLLLIFTESFDTAGYLSDLAKFYRKVLAFAYEKGLVGHIPRTAWESAFARLRDIIAENEQGYYLRGDSLLYFVHPSYSEALWAASEKTPDLEAVWFEALRLASEDESPDLRKAAARCLGINYARLTPEMLALVPALARDPSVMVRSSLALFLGYRYENLTGAGRDLLFSFANDANPVVRDHLTMVLPIRWPSLDASARAAVRALANGHSFARFAVTLALGLRYRELDDEGRALLDQVRASLEDDSVSPP